MAPEYTDRVDSMSPQPNLEEVLLVMGGRSLDDSDDEDDEDEEDRDPRLVPRNCAFYNTKTSMNLLCTFQNVNFVYVQNPFHCRDLSIRLPLKKY